MPDAAASHHFNLPLLRRRAWWVAFGCIVTALASLAAAAAQLILVTGPGSGRVEWVAGEDFYILIAAAYLATGIVWLFWLYRAVANLKAHVAPAMTWSPAAAVIWCLIPFVNLVMQFFVMRSVWQATWARSDGAPALVTATALSALLPSAAVLWPVLQTGDIAAMDLRAEALANALQAVASIALMLLTLNITRGQAERRDPAAVFA